MARQKVAVQVNQFIGGLNTEANPLSFPPNFSSDEENMELGRDGSRSRRNGFDFEEDAVLVDTSISPQESLFMARGQFRWENPGDQPGKQFLVVQLGNYVGVHDLDSTAISDGLIYSTIFDPLTYGTPYGFTALDGSLIVATGLKQVTILSYQDGVVTESLGDLLVRDFWGVESIVDGVDLKASDNSQIRPTTLSQPHIYNLRNQGFALPRLDGSGDSTLILDPIKSFSDVSLGSFPSNADNMSQFIFPNANFGTDRTADRFNPFSMLRNTPYNTKAPNGYFIIKALDRGSSRLEQLNKLHLSNPILSYPPTTLPSDTTPTGPVAVAGYAGRVWYGGFSGRPVDGDNQSPSLASYVLFSQVGEGINTFFKCFQEADPTSHIDSDIVDTDGGFLKIDGAYGIKALTPVGNSLFVFAENGVWRVVGGDENAFTATNYTVSKLFNYGCIGPASVVTDGAIITYWGDKAIYAVQQDNTRTWVVQDISQKTVQTLFNTLTTEDKNSCSGYYDPESASIRWVYGHTSSTKDSRELILNIPYNAFTKNRVSVSGVGYGILSISGGQVSINSPTPIVTVSGEEVTVGGEDVYITLTNFSRDPSKSFYCIQTSYSPTIEYTFGGYRREDTTNDWETPTEGIDTPAYLIAGSITGGDGRLNKNTPYLTTYFKQTEEYADVTSSCLLSSQWNWTNSSSSNKWSMERQAYRPTTHLMGGTILVTRNKVRGFGRSVAFKFKSEAGKFMHIYGWEFNLEATGEE